MSRGFAGPSFANHGFAGRGFAGHGFTGHGVPAFAGHSFVSQGGHALTVHGNAARLTTGGLAATHNAGQAAATHNARQAATAGGLAATHNALAAHTQLGTANMAVTHVQFAHNQFAAQNFHSLHNFVPTGFNRNAFGDAGHWNHWGGRFWGAGWHHWGFGWGGWAGPVFWPFLFGDICSFAFWPYGYYDPFWAFGPDFILVSIFAPGPYFGPDYGYAPDYTGYWAPPDIYYGGYSGDYYGGYAGSYSGRHTGGYYGRHPGGRYAARSQAYQGLTEADRQALAETNTAASESCSGLAPGVTDLPTERIKNTVRPTGDQAAALDDLNAAVAKANDAIKASCPTAVPLTPMARLDAAEARLSAMIQAVDIVRDPLQRFYVLLSDEQRQRFNAMGDSGGGQAPAGGQRGCPLQRKVERCNQTSGGAH